MDEPHNPYLAPENSSLDPQSAEPRPFLSFLAGAICLGSSVPFLLLVAAFLNYLISMGVSVGFSRVMERPSDQKMAIVGLLCGLCAAFVISAGCCFLIRKGRRGRWLLVPFALSLGCLVAFFYFADN